MVPEFYSCPHDLCHYQQEVTPIQIFIDHLLCAGHCSRCQRHSSKPIKGLNIPVIVSSGGKHTSYD